ncbi:MAG: hypothetical protein J4400_04000 [Candidatus Aenigmarchaeota archaeon]|nr:hypothetical protein [Candidatus Aenigmarchaeota archaeon]
MSLEEEMHNEAGRLEKEMQDMDIQLKKLHDKIFNLLALREKKEHDLKALKDSFAQNYIEKETERMIEGIIRGKQKAKI